MSQLIKAFTASFFILLMMVSSIGLLGGYMQTLHAQNLHNAFVVELENSDFANPVLEECFSVAETSGYKLEMNLYFKNGGVATCTSTQDIPADCSDIQLAEVVLTFPLQIPIFEVDIEQELFGYAR